jgi:hypothetical protein
MTLPDDETIAEEVLEEVEVSPTSMPSTITSDLESGMDTGQGADDEPELTIGDRHISDAAQVTTDEARRLLGENNG